MPHTNLLLLLSAVFAPAVLGALTLLIPRRSITPRVLIALLGSLASIASLLAVGLSSDAVGIEFVPSLHMNLTFMPDPLGMFFGLLVSGIGCLIVLYARGYFGADEESLYRFYPTLGLFTTAMMGIVLSDNMLGMFLFWELTSISSFLLIGWDRENPRAVRLALQAMIVTGGGGLSLLGGLMLLGIATDAWSFSSLHSALANGLTTLPRADLLPLAFVLIFIGAAAKSAQWPFHFWLPGAMAAPTPVSAYLHSATMVKAGVYLFARLFPALGASGAAGALAYWPTTLVAFGAITMLIGGYFALRSTELKRIFAYTTVSQLGLLTCAYGLGGYSYHDESNIVWPVTQILNHALYKAPLFIIAGAIMHLTGRKELPQLAGLWRTHRTLALVCLLAAYALAGGPFTLSFIAKEAFFAQIVHGASSAPMLWAVGAMGVLTAICNVAIFIRLATTFLRRPDALPVPRQSHDPHASGDNLAENHGQHEAEGGFWGTCLWWPAALLVLWQYVGGIAPATFGQWLTPIETHRHYLESLAEGGFLYAVAHPSLPLAMSMAAGVAGILLGLSPLLRRPQDDPHDDLFPAYFRVTDRVGYRLFRMVQSGNIRIYLTATLLAMIAALAGVLALNAGSLLTWPQIASLPPGRPSVIIAGSLLTLIICTAALVLPLVSSRVIRVMILGTCGFSVTGMYLVNQAPDLALTQLMFEIISVVLFVLVLRLLPEEPKVVRALPFGRLAFAATVGLTVGWTVLQAGAIADQSAINSAAHSAGGTTLASHLPDANSASMMRIAQETAPTSSEVENSKWTGESPRLGDWFLKHSYKGSEDSGGRSGGGHNVVNVILVDFRGYDTLGEITVLTIALMGVLAMLSAVPRGALRHVDATVCTIGAQPHLRSSLFRTGMRFILPLSLVFAAYVFVKGHNEPGGGFIAGLIAAVGLAVYRMAEGLDALRRLVPIKPGVLAALGLGIALLTAITPLFFGLPLLTSDQWYIPRAGTDPLHLSSVVFFDLGVFIVVVGVAVGMVNRFEEELE